MDASNPPPVLPSFEDRRTGLIVFGIFAILIGAACALFVPLAFFGQMVAARQTGTAFDASAAFLSAAVYGLMAVAMIWLGVGSILARRWARALLLCIGWIGLVIGLIAMPAVVMAMSTLGETMRAAGQTVTPGMIAIIKAISLAITFVIYIVIPGVAVLFYRSPQVKHTCEVRDPVERWTDRCPLPVLALCVIMGFTALLLLCILPSYGRIFPLAGRLLTGWPARFMWLALVVFMLYAARGFYRLEIRIWWIYTVGSLLLWISSLLTIQSIGLINFYRQMGMPERQIDLMAHSPLLTGGTFAGLSLLSMTVWLGYLLYVKRYFRPLTGRPVAAAG
ncbi:MAG: hypothetical protein ABI222_10500 [Opitutaceae bacterium]